MTHSPILLLSGTLGALVTSTASMTSEAVYEDGDDQSRGRLTTLDE